MNVEFKGKKCELPYFLIVINDHLDCREEETVNSFLRDVNFVDFDVVMIMALLRTTFQWRSRLSNWELCLDKAKKEIDSRGLDSGHILRGLFVTRQN